MELSDGQVLALNQLERIANIEGSALRVDYVVEKDDASAVLDVDISLDCTHYTREEGGLDLHARESVRLCISPDFPYKVPSVSTVHTRFLGFAHVQWGRILCLYQSPEAQWQPSRGMLGFIEQLNHWFEKAAINQLDYPEGPLHPPVAYTSSSTTICIYSDTPTKEHWPWFGAALISERKPSLLDINSWKEVAELNSDTRFAPVLLLDFELSFEYPRTIHGLFYWLEKRGINTSRILVHLMIAAERLNEGEFLHFVIGTPSRGKAGEMSSRLQHLQVWEIEPRDVQIIRTASLACDIQNSYQGKETPEEIKVLIDDVLNSLFEWKRNCAIRWCKIMENRPEIVTRRDKDSDMEWFKGKTVSLWGCGALGGVMAESIVRAGVKKFILYDNKIVTPGILVRQNFIEEDINNNKTEALKRRLAAITDTVEIEINPLNLIQFLDIDQWKNESDLIIDATASMVVRSKLEACIKNSGVTVPVCTAMISGAAKHGVVVLARENYSGGPLDILRRLGLSVMNRPWLGNWVSAFWSDASDEPMRQPEPGCSDPTFVGSHADVTNLAARILNRLAIELKTDDTHAMGCLLAQNATDELDQVFNFKPDIVIRGDGMEFRFAMDAWRDAKGWIRQGARVRSSQDETGGLLFGHIDETLRVAWITNVSGPPAHSEFSSEKFICGTDGTQQLCEQYNKQSNGSAKYVGTWHTHPISPAQPSSTDYGGIATIFTSNPTDGAYQLMMIIGHAAQENTEIGMYAFERSKISFIKDNVNLEMNARGGVCVAPVIPSYGISIGLSLSGGGSRAVAFHLGTLRALEDLGLLEDVNVISAVSGGSLMTGMMGYTNEPFDIIDQRVIDFLKKGLVRPAFKKLMHPKRGLQIIIVFIIVRIPTLMLGIAKSVLGTAASLFTGSAAINEKINNLGWPLRRWYSRTHVMADAIEDIVGSHVCDDETRGRKSIVFNACELQTGTAFRMSNEHYGSWRYGYSSASEMRLADAVSASAAFPVLLPAFDWVRMFTRNDIKTKQRVIITDGGVFENIGVSVMEPGRDSNFSKISYKPKIIIASDAGAGQMKGDSRPNNWPSRMEQVVNSVMRKVTDATKQRLHSYVANGKLERFAYVQLGQIDSKVPLKPSTWVDRNAVMNYPTDFSAMTDLNIELLSDRGEIITRTLVTQYLLGD